MANKLSKNKSVTTAVIPAGGLGTRLFPLTKNMPKELLEINGHPMIYYALNELVIAGIKKVVVISAPHKERLDTFLNTNLSENNIPSQIKATQHVLNSLDIQVVHQTSQNGLGDAISYAESYIDSEYFLLLLPDEIVFGSPNPSEVLLEHWNKFKASYVSIDTVPPSEISNYGIVGFEGTTNLSDEGPWKINNFVEKPELSNAPSNMSLTGRYLLSRDIFDILRATKSGKNAEIQLTDALQTHLLASEVFLGAKLTGRRFDAGSQAGIIATSAYASEYTG